MTRRKRSLDVEYIPPGDVQQEMEITGLYLQEIKSCHSDPSLGNAPKSRREFPGLAKTLILV